MGADSRAGPDEPGRLALLEGRKACPGNVAFGKWCAANGFTLDARDRSDAMWFAENHDDVMVVFGNPENSIPSRPGDIRKAYRKAKLRRKPGG